MNSLRCALFFTVCIAFVSGYALKDNMCVGEEDGTLFSDPDDCASFFICNAGLPWRQRCPGYLLWNEEKETCDFEVNVNCGERPIVPPTSTPHPTETTSTEAPPMTTPPTTPPTTTLVA
uniref:Putative peritrophin-like protein 3 n=1 Tax=Xenopsylla cheopis TaxID=163159 RepID=A0A6M2DX90_XENCH